MASVNPVQVKFASLLLEPESCSLQARPPPKAKTEHRRTYNLESFFHTLPPVIVFELFEN
ncbi:MAG: hypothetical protein ACLRSW_14745 [Christensenellaceae bacterium]